MIRRLVVAVAKRARSSHPLPFPDRPDRRQLPLDRRDRPAEFPRDLLVRVPLHLPHRHLPQFARRPTARAAGRTPRSPRRRRSGGGPARGQPPARPAPNRPRTAGWHDARPRRRASRVSCRTRSNGLAGGDDEQHLPQVVAVVQPREPARPRPRGRSCRTRDSATSSSSAAARGSGSQPGAGERDEPGEVPVPQRLGGRRVAGLQLFEPDRHRPDGRRRPCSCHSFRRVGCHLPPACTASAILAPSGGTARPRGCPRARCRGSRRHPPGAGLLRGDGELLRVLRPHLVPQSHQFVTGQRHSHPALVNAVTGEESCESDQVCGRPLVRGDRQIPAVRSSLAVKTRRPSGLNSAVLTRLLVPKTKSKRGRGRTGSQTDISGVRGCPVAASQTRTVPSAPAVRTRLSSGANEADTMRSACANGDNSGLPLSTSHTRPRSPTTATNRCPLWPRAGRMNRRLAGFRTPPALTLVRCGRPKFSPSRPVRPRPSFRPA